MTRESESGCGHCSFRLPRIPAAPGPCGALALLLDPDDPSVFRIRSPGAARLLRRHHAREWGADGDWTVDRIFRGQSSSRYEHPWRTLPSWVGFRLAGHTRFRVAQSVRATW